MDSPKKGEKGVGNTKGKENHLAIINKGNTSFRQAFEGGSWANRLANRQKLKKEHIHHILNQKVI